MTAELVERAHAKVNLHLHVVGRRNDGYHLLDSLVVFAAAHDVLRARVSPAAVGSAAPEPVLALSGPFGHVLGGGVPGGVPNGGAPADNLVSRAAAAFAARAGVPLPPLRFELEKHLPVASGIGGGSADAAAALRLLRALTDPPSGDPAPDDAVLHAIAAELGADVPVCLGQAPALMGGIGERLAPAPELPSCGLLLVNPGVAVSTPAVFRARAPGFRAPATFPPRWSDVAAMAGDLRALENDLEPPAIALCPPIKTVLTAIRTMPGCLLARMSGSGATCFGLFPTPAAAEAAAVVLEREHWWCSGGAPLKR